MLRILFACVVFLSTISAHPVVFKNGKVFWVTQNSNYNDLKFGISKTSIWLIGGRVLHDRKLGETFALVDNNYLAKRWNSKNSQANVYFLSSVGVNTENSKSMGVVGLHGDWENRQIMIMQMLEYYSHNSSWVSSSRIAYSPFTVDYTKMSTWLIAQYRVEYRNDKFSYMFIPVVRLFKNNYMFEFGSNGKDSFLSLMTHF
jgi:hypothetical protein